MMECTPEIGRCHSVCTLWSLRRKRSREKFTGIAGVNKYQSEMAEELYNGEGYQQVHVCTANERPMRIYYKCPIHAFPEMKLRGLVISKT
jgi:hypothetical protein